MNFKDVVKSALTEYMKDLQRALEGLAQEERRFQPAPECNHIDFTVWHMARVEDSIVNRRLCHDRHIWDRDTIGGILSHLIVEEAQHVGQIAYIRGMQRGFEG